MVVRCALLVVCGLRVCRSLLLVVGGWCELCDVRCSLFVAGCLLCYVVCCLLHVVC